MPGISDTGGQSLGVSYPNALRSFYLYVDGSGGCGLSTGQERPRRRRENPLGMKEESLVHPVAGPSPSIPRPWAPPIPAFRECGCFCGTLCAQKGSAQTLMQPAQALLLGVTGFTPSWI